VTVAALADASAVLVAATALLLGALILLVLRMSGLGRSARRRATLPTADAIEAAKLTACALELDGAARDAFLDDACSGRPAIRREIESLLAASERSGMLDTDAAELFAAIAPTSSIAPPPPGRAVSHYRIGECVGRGGMGVVYEARDTRLERTVALKFLPPAISADAGAKQRFMHEAQAAAALDHPNICTIHEVGETGDGQLFIAMPFYDGETMKQRIARGPLDLSEALDVALQTARGLAKNTSPASVSSRGCGMLRR
jgi:hypothetical protein